MERLTKNYSDGTHGASDDLPCGEKQLRLQKFADRQIGKYEV